MICTPLAIVIVPFPFADDLDKIKYRPALVVSSQKYNQNTGCTILAMITSAKKSSFWNDYKIKDYHDTNLQGDCLIRMKLFTLDNRLLKTKVGVLNKIDAANIKKILNNILI